MRYLGVLAVVSLILTVTATAGATSIDLSTSGYNYDIPAGGGDITIISFDYTYGAALLPLGHAAFRIRRLNDDGTDSWLGSFNIYANSFNLDTDYGPYSKNGQSLAGENNYKFTLNRSNGLWDLAVNAVPIDFAATAATNNPQPDGASVTPGSLVTNKFFSDESMQSGLNAIALGWATLAPEGDHLHGNAADGVGGTGAYRLQFEDVAEGYVDNIEVSIVPEPVTMAGLALGIGSLATYIRRRRAA